MRWQSTRVDLSAIRAIEGMQADLRHAAREVRRIIRRQREQLSENERVLEWAKKAMQRDRDGPGWGFRAPS